MVSEDGDGGAATSDRGVQHSAVSVDHAAVILNPESGDGTHVAETRELADEHGYAVYETNEPGGGVDRTIEAIANGATVVAACGGDGTVNEVVKGIDEADAFDDVTFGVLPGGTGNNFASNVGVDSIPHGFEVLERRDVRAVDVGVTDEMLFVNSCVGGLTAESSSATSADLKETLGTVAYVMTTLRELSDYDGFEIELASRDDDDPLWSGTAVCVFVGNARRAGEDRAVQANVEDGLLDVTIVEEMPPTDLLQTATAFRLFGEERDSITRLHAPSLEVVVEDTETPAFSFDGEIRRVDRLDASVREGVLSLCVGDDYDPNPVDD